jgi:hypothetical protein
MSIVGLAIAVGLYYIAARCQPEAPFEVSHTERNSGYYVLSGQPYASYYYATYTRLESSIGLPFNHASKLYL